MALLQDVAHLEQMQIIKQLSADSLKEQGTFAMTLIQDEYCESVSFTVGSWIELLTKYSLDANE